VVDGGHSLAEGGGDGLPDLRGVQPQSSVASASVSKSRLLGRLLVVGTAVVALLAAAPAAGTAGPPGLVAAYGFEEGSGSTTADASGSGNAGTLVNATWVAAGKYGKALSFNGTSARVDVPDAASLHLSSGMTLEAWVDPAVVGNSWRDVVYKGNDNFYLEEWECACRRGDHRRLVWGGGCGGCADGWHLGLSGADV
jgi:hypothetical protein